MNAPVRLAQALGGPRRAVVVRPSFVARAPEPPTSPAARRCRTGAWLIPATVALLLLASGVFTAKALLVRARAHEDGPNLLRRSLALAATEQTALEDADPGARRRRPPVVVVMDPSAALEAENRALLSADYAALAAEDRARDEAVKAAR